METLDHDPEINAIREVYTSLKDLDSEAQSRVIEYVARMLNIFNPLPDAGQPEREQRAQDVPSLKINVSKDDSNSKDEDLGGISPLAKKWMIRSGLTTKALSSIFSLDVDEIDLIAGAVPGKGMREKMHSVILLMGVSAYLASGAWRFTHEQLKDTCLHYDAYDAAHFATYLKQYSSEVTGSKSTGYSLTPRGQTNATEMVKAMVKEK